LADAWEITVSEFKPCAHGPIETAVHPGGAHLRAHAPESIGAAASFPPSAGPTDVPQLKIRKTTSERISLMAIGYETRFDE
jgi:hypothetical protein